MSDLPARFADTDHLRIAPACPAPPAPLAAALVRAWDKLFAQFAREGRVGDHFVGWCADGPFLLACWSGGADLSGCSKDKLARALVQVAADSGVELLTPPPVPLLLAGETRFVARSQLRAAYAAGEVDETTEVWDPLVTTVGAWRAGRRRPLAEHWAARFLGLVRG